MLSLLFRDVTHISRRALRAGAYHSRRLKSSNVDQKPIQDINDLDSMFGKTKWSPKDLLPSEQQIQQSTEVTPKQLRHLLRLCALPPPENVHEEAKMLSDLRAQLHFVNEIQKINTDDVKPLQSLRDETAAATKENEITLESMKDALAMEEIVGKHHRRIRQKKDVQVDPRGSEDWDVLGQAAKKVGKYFVVESRSAESP